MSALVTGGSRGLGRAAAAALTARGVPVAVTGRDPVALQGVVDAGQAALALPGDAVSRADVVAAVQRTEDALGPLGLLVANAGRFATGGPLWESDPDDWWRDVEVNLRGPQVALWAALPGMVERGAGRVVLLGSGFGNRTSPWASAYAASKAALHRLAETVAAELAGTGVVVLAVSPGMVRTDMTRAFPEGLVARRPELGDPPPSAWTPVERLTGLLGRVLDGELDGLSGRFVHVSDDLGAARGAQDPDAGTLRLVPWQ